MSPKIFWRRSEGGKFGQDSSVDCRNHCWRFWKRRSASGEWTLKGWLQTEHDEYLVADFILVANRSRHLDLGQPNRRLRTLAGGVRLRTLKKGLLKVEALCSLCSSATGQARVRHPRYGPFGFVPPGGAPSIPRPRISSTSP
jgi:hypothetical protein